MDLLLFLFIPSCFLCIIMAGSIYHGARSKYWPTVNGEIIFSKVAHYKENILSNGVGFNFYRPVIHYEYSVEDRHFISKRIGNYLGFGNNQKFAEQIIKKFPVNESITVYYHPLFNSFSALMPGAKQNTMHVIMLVVSSILSIFSGVTLFA